ncbi:MAG: hypothetical protein HQL12_03065 [Candidatus Omnitrophica bacterium]|nr:hypothetical protein [Candidatus Omnitrophota bacterium]
MLQFSTKPDKVFTEIVSNAIYLAIPTLKYGGQDVLKNVLPNASRVFDLETAIETLERLDHYHKSLFVYELNDYHFILIYDLLEGYCELFNEDELKCMSIKGTKITKIDFDSLSSLYFFDEDFLTPKRRILDPKIINFLHFTLESIGVIMGLKPSPRNLENRLIPLGEHVFPKEDAPFYRPESTEYPDYSILDEMEREEARRAGPPSSKLQKILNEKPWENLGLPEEFED